ncbi:MAG: ribonuclease P protein component [Bacteroidota bacterium]
MRRMQTFTKEERLSGKKQIEELMEKGNSFTVFPLRVVWKETRMSVLSPARIAISVPKRSFKKAVDRNRIKRQIREAYRKSKAGLYSHLAGGDKKINVMLVYTGKELPEYRLIESKMAEVLRQLKKRV